MKLYLKLNTKMEDKELKECSHTLLLKALNLNEKDVVKNEKGKPYLKDNSFYFNLSHSKDSFGFVKSDSEVGFDIEKSRDLVNFSNLEKKILNENDKRNFEEINSKILLKIWTIKEAYLKFLGIGLITNPSKIIIDYKTSEVSMPSFDKASFFSDEIDGIIFSVVGKVDSIDYEIL